MAENIKREPEDMFQNNNEDIAEEESVGSPKSVSNVDVSLSMYESLKDAASADKKPNRQVTNMEKKKSEDFPRSDMNPDRTMSDFYCNICDAHMNSEQMWESHISGKRHLKNVKKEPGEMPSKVKAIKVEARPIITDTIKKIHEPLVGLAFMTELQRADPHLNPSYTCHLCQANCTWSVVIDHILTTKHRLAYLKAIDPVQYTILENLDLKKTSLDQLAEDKAREYERKQGCGTMEVKLEKPKVAPPPPKREEEIPVEHHSRSLSSGSRKRQVSPDEDYKRAWSRSPKRARSRSSHQKYRHESSGYKRTHSPVDERWRHDRCSTDSSPSRVPHTNCSTAKIPDVRDLPIEDKVRLLRQISENYILIKEEHVRATKNIIADLSARVLEYKIRTMPFTNQNKIVKSVVRGEIRSFEKELEPTLNYIFETVGSPYASPRPSNHRRHRHHRHSSSSSRRRH